MPFVAGARQAPINVVTAPTRGGGGGGGGRGEGRKCESRTRAVARRWWASSLNSDAECSTKEIKYAREGKDG